MSVFNSLHYNVVLSVVLVFHGQRNQPSTWKSLKKFWFLLSEFFSNAYQGCTKRPSLHSVFGPRWWSDPGSHQTLSLAAASLATWCRRPRPTPWVWSGQTNCGTRCKGEQKEDLADEKKKWRKEMFLKLFGQIFFCRYLPVWTKICWSQIVLTKFAKPGWKWLNNSENPI